MSKLSQGANSAILSLFAKGEQKTTAIGALVRAEWFNLAAKVINTGPSAILETARPKASDQAARTAFDANALASMLAGVGKPTKTNAAARAAVHAFTLGAFGVFAALPAGKRLAPEQSAKEASKLVDCLFDTLAAHAASVKAQRDANKATKDADKATIAAKGEENAKATQAALVGKQSALAPVAAVATVAQLLAVASASEQVIILGLLDKLTIGQQSGKDDTPAKPAKATKAKKTASA